MSLFSDGIVNMNVGETLIGVDEGRNVNVRMEGREAFISHEDIVNGGGVQLFDQPTGRRSKVRVMRNTSLVTYYAGMIVKTNPAAGIAGSAHATGLGTAAAEFVVVVDPALGPAGVAPGELFLAFVQGPAKVLTPAAGIDLSAAGLPLIAGANGFANKGTAGATAVLGHFKTGILLAADCESVLLEVDLNPYWA